MPDYFLDNKYGTRTRQTASMRTPEEGEEENSTTGKLDGDYGGAGEHRSRTTYAFGAGRRACLSH